MKTNQPLLNIGQFLKDKREEKKLSLKDLSLKTCISVEMLKALENGSSEKLPVYAYLRGFILAYAKEVNVKEKDILQEIKLLSPDFLAKGEQDSSVEALDEATNETEEFHLMPIATAVGILLVLGGVLVFLNVSRNSNSENSFLPKAQNIPPSTVVAKNALSSHTQSEKLHTSQLEETSSIAIKKPSEDKDFFSSYPKTPSLEVVVKALGQVSFSYKLDDKKKKIKTISLKKGHFEVLRADKFVWISTEQSSKIQILKNGENLGVLGSGGKMEKLFSK